MPAGIEHVRLHVREHSGWVRYGVAVAAVAAGCLLRGVLTALVGEGLPTYITFYPSVITAALLAGLGPGLLATAATLAVVDYWLVSPRIFFWHASPVEVTAMALFLAMGMFISMLTEFHRGLERRLGEEAAKRSLALRTQHTLELLAHRDRSEAEQRYRTVADFTYDWELWKAPDGALLYCSPSCERITGHTAAALVGDPGLLTRMVHPEDRAIWQRHDCSAVAAAERRTTAFRIARADGGIRWIEHICQPVIGTQGEALGVRASNRDITDRKESEIEMQHLRDDLARVSRITAAGQLAAALAHELSQPLGAIVCNAQAAEQYLGQVPPALSEVLEILTDIGADGQRAGNVIQRLRALYQKTAHERTAVQLNTVIHETVELMHSELVIKGTSISSRDCPRSRATTFSYSRW